MDNWTKPSMHTVLRTVVPRNNQDKSTPKKNHGGLIAPDFLAVYRYMNTESAYLTYRQAVEYPVLNLLLEMTMPGGRLTPP